MKNNIEGYLCRTLTSTNFVVANIFLCAPNYADLSTVTFLMLCCYPEEKKPSLGGLGWPMARVSSHHFICPSLALGQDLAAPCGI